MKNCPNCLGELAGQVETCPNCGENLAKYQLATPRKPEKQKKGGNRLLRIAGIILTVIGGLNTILSVFMIMANDFSEEFSMLILLLVYTVGSVVFLLAGIAGVKNSVKPEKPESSITLGIFAAVFSIPNFIIATGQYYSELKHSIEMAVYTDITDLLYIFLNLFMFLFLLSPAVIVPFYLIGAFKHQREDV